MPTSVSPAGGSLGLQTLPCGSWRAAGLLWLEGLSSRHVGPGSSFDELVAFLLQVNSAEFYSCGEGTQQDLGNALVVPPKFSQAVSPPMEEVRTSLYIVMWKVLRNQSHFSFPSLNTGESGVLGKECRLAAAACPSTD